LYVFEFLALTEQYLFFLAFSSLLLKGGGRVNTRLMQVIEMIPSESRLSVGVTKWVSRAMQNPTVLSKTIFAISMPLFHLTISFFFFILSLVSV